MRSSALFASLVLSCGLTACLTEDPQPKNTPEQAKQAKADLLMAKTWELTGATSQYGTAAVEDKYAEMEACKKDDLYTFRVNGVFYEDRGSQVCGGLGPRYHTGTWSLGADGTELTFSRYNAAVTSSIQELTATKLVLKETENKAGMLVVHISTYSGR